MVGAVAWDGSAGRGGCLTFRIFKGRSCCWISSVIGILSVIIVTAVTGRKDLSSDDVGFAIDWSCASQKRADEGKSEEEEGMHVYFSSSRVFRVERVIEMLD